MTETVRPMTTLVVRLWREPGAPEGDAGWRGMVRPLEQAANASPITFQGLDHLLAAVHQALRHSPPNTENEA